MTAATSQIVSQLQRSIARAIYGKEEAIQLSLITLLARGHLLIEDVPGVGKTTLAQALAKSFHCSFQRIQFTSDLLPSDVLGVSVYNPETREFEFRSGPVFANVVLADEINRTTPRTQSALLEAMNEAQVTVDGKTLPLPQPFLVIATQNPVEHHGTYPLPESQLDRFLMRIRMGYPSHETEREILRKRTGDNDSIQSLEPVADVGDVLAMQHAVAQVTVDSSLHDYALEIVARTRHSDQLSLGVSPRGTLMLLRAAQARAFLDGRGFCIPDDFKQLAVAVFSHRVVANSRHASLQKKTETTEAVLRDIVESVPVPV
jgi:MoxR-like ATPase